MGLILALLVALIILGLPTWPYATGLGYGYYPSGGFTLLLLILLVVMLSRRRI